MKTFQINHRRFEVLDAGDFVSEPDIAALERKIGTQLPAQLRSYYLQWNGGLPYPLDLPEDSTVCVRLRWKEGADAASWGPVASLHELFLINANPARDFFRTWRDFEDRIPSDCLCFARDPGGSLFLIGIRPHNLGRIYFWSRYYEADLDAGELPSYDNIADVADSFNDFLLALREESQSDESLDAWVQRVYSE